MVATTYVLISFGDNLDFHSQANFCFLTLKKFATNNSRFVIYTDHPEFYQWVSSFVEIRTIQKNQIQEWIGKYNYFYRVKLKVLLDACEKYEGHLIYLDSDTIASKDLSEMNSKLDEGFSLMHLKENLLCEDTASDKKDMWNKIKNRSYVDILINKQTAMWNSGVIALPEKDKFTLLSKALVINDQLCEEGVECRVKEQFAIGIVLEHTHKLIEAQKWIIHYWGNKEEWNLRINIFFSKKNQYGLSAEDTVQRINILEWGSLPINRMKTSLGKKLARWAHKYCPDKVKLCPNQKVSDR